MLIVKGGSFKTENYSELNLEIFCYKITIMNKKTLILNEHTTQI